MWKSSRIAISCLGMLTGLGCTGASQGADAGSAGIDAALTGPVLVGAAGGTVSGPHGARLVVPPDALSAEVEITLEEVSAPTWATFETTPVGATYRVLPHGLTFAAPVTLDLPVTPAGMPLTLFTLADDADTTWEAVDGGTIDATGGHVQVSHFSYFSYGVCDPVRHVCWPCDLPGSCDFGPDAGPPVDAGPFDAGPPSCATACTAPEECLFVPDSSPSRGWWDCRQPCTVDADCPAFVPTCMGTGSVLEGSVWCTAGGCTGAQTVITCMAGTTCTAGVCS